VIFCFSIYLRRTLTIDSPVSVIPASTKRVFIVDDSADVRELFTLLAQLNGFILETAKNGEEALKKLASLETEPSIVFVDLNMPVMSGTEFLREVCERGLAASSHIVIFSATDKGSLACFDRSLTWLAKPFELEDVLKAINLPRLH
jgi:CheY-like chemotaxis protein